MRAHFWPAAGETAAVIEKARRDETRARPKTGMPLKPEDLQAAGERGSEAGIEMADRLLTATEGRVAGTYIMPSFGRYEQCAELVRRIRARHPVVAAAS